MNEKTLTKRDLRDLLIIGGLILITWLVLRKSIDLNLLKEMIGQMTWRYLALAFVMLFVFWGLEATIIGWLIHRVNRRVKRRKLPWIAVKTTLIGQYYANITPFASGGQPVQLHVLKQNKLTTSEGTAVLVSKFLIFQVTVTLYALLLFISALTSTPSGSKPFVLTGLTINLIGLTLIGLGAFKPKFLIAPLDWLGEHFQKSKVRIEGFKKKTRRFIEDYQNGMGRLTKNYTETLVLFFISILQLTAFFSMPYFLSLALGIQGLHFTEMLAIQAILYMCVSFIPIPGTLGASEFGFVALFGQVMTQNIAGTLMVLWRLVSYYFSIIFCGLFSLLASLGDKWQEKIKLRN